MQELVQAYYGQELQSSADLKTSACCDADAVPAWLKPLLARLHPEVTEKYYGCGLVCPPCWRAAGCSIWAAAAAVMCICWPSWWEPAERWWGWT